MSKSQKFFDASEHLSFYTLFLLLLLNGVSNVCLATAPEIELESFTTLESLADADLKLHSEPLLPADHPDWVAAADRFDGPIHKLGIVTIPCQSREKSLIALRQIAFERFSNYVKTQVNSGNTTVVEILEQEELLDKILPPGYRFATQIEQGGQTKFRTWGQLQISPDLRQRIATLQRQSEWKLRSAFVLFLISAGTLACGLMHIGLVWVNKRQKHN